MERELYSSGLKGKKKVGYDRWIEGCEDVDHSLIKFQSLEEEQVENDCSVSVLLRVLRMSENGSGGIMCLFNVQVKKQSQGFFPPMSHVLAPLYCGNLCTSLIFQTGYLILRRSDCIFRMS